MHSWQAVFWRLIRTVFAPRPEPLLSLEVEAAIHKKNEAVSQALEAIRWICPK